MYSHFLNQIHNSAPAQPGYGVESFSFMERGGGAMFVGRQNFPRCRDVISLVVIIWINISKTNACMYVHGDIHVNSWTWVTHESHKHWIPANNDDSTVCYILWSRSWQLTVLFEQTWYWGVKKNSSENSMLPVWNKTMYKMPRASLVKAGPTL